VPPRAAASRIALVIGNAEYLHASTLANPMSDAAAVAQAFKRLGFETELHHNLGLMELRRAFANYSEASENAEMAVVYFAGHGVEIAGVNYLVPVDAQPETVGRVRWETMPLDEVLSVVDGAKQLRLIILDACRDNPFVGRIRGLEATRSLGRGLGSIEPRGNMLVAYAAKHGTKANDGPLGGNSPFAEALVQHVESPDLEIRLLFGKVRDTVLEKTNNNQEPHLYGTLGGEPIYLKRVITDPGRGAATDADAHEAMQALRDHRLLESKDIALVDAWLRTYGLKAPEFQREVVRKHRDTLLVTENADWHDAHARDDAAAYQEFLGVWPTGPHAADANRRLVDLQGKKQAADAWAAVCDSESLAALDAFLVDFAGPFTAAAQARLDVLRAAAGRRGADEPKQHASAAPFRSWLARNVGGWDRFLIYIAFYLLACLASAMPFWAGLLWVICVCAVAVAFWVIDRKSRRTKAATATQVQPPNESVPQAAATNIAPQRTGSRYLPLTIAAAALVAGVICGMLQSALFTAALATVFMFVRALFLSASVALAAWLHERNYRLAAWVFGIVAAGYLAGQQMYVAAIVPTLRSLQFPNSTTYYITVSVIFMTIPVVPISALAAWRFRALPSIWILACLIGAGLLVGLAIPFPQSISLVQNFIIPWTLWGACIGSILSRRKAAI
jgi:hypothetical protein